MSVTIIIISSSPTLSTAQLSPNFLSNARGTAIFFRRSRIPLFSIDKQRRTRVCTPSAALFSGCRYSRERGRTMAAEQGRPRSFVQINFQRGQGYTRERLRFADRNCRNRDRWIFQRILCSVLAPPRLTAHTFRSPSPSPPPLSVAAVRASSAFSVLSILHKRWNETKFSWIQVASRCSISLRCWQWYRFIFRDRYWFTRVTSFPRFEIRIFEVKAKKKKLFISRKTYCAVFPRDIKIKQLLVILYQFWQKIWSNR